MISKLVTPGTLFVAALVVMILAMTMATGHRPKLPHVSADGVRPVKISALSVQRSVVVDMALHRQDT
ncbi:hypothetical protein HGO38_12135 [Rhizobium sp. CG5]|uniref:hypothetical protein n=1 Tax=Rhizobium sp. CG5 TaxID=2726076 RepID=UPI0020339612|nr:hypothetical protein [Rhizobium sp. CG5]MCM2474223.1 hypothetical protein [Rhizobium sp. CG5]